MSAVIATQPAPVPFGVVLGLLGGGVLLAVVPRPQVMLSLWIALTGYAFSHALGVRMNASDTVLPFLVVSTLGVASKHNLSVIPRMVRPCMFFALPWSLLALLNGVTRVGSLTPEVILSTFGALVVAYCIVCTVYVMLPDIASIQRAVLVFIVAGSVWNFIGLVRYVPAGGGRLGGMLINANAYGMFVSVILICQIAYLIHYKTSYGRRLAFVNLLALFAGLLLSASKAAWLGVLLVLPLFFLTSNVRGRGRLLFVAMFVLGSSWLLIRGLGAQEFLKFVSLWMFQEHSVSSRQITTLFALRLWMSDPLTMLMGIGVGVYRQLYAYFTTGAAGSLHNTYVMLLVEQGVVGLLAWLSVIGVAVSQLWRRRRLLLDEHQWLARAVMFSVLCTLMQGVAHDISNQRHLWLFVGLAVAIGEYARTLSVSDGTGAPARRTLRGI